MSQKIAEQRRTRIKLVNTTCTVYMGYFETWWSPSGSSDSNIAFHSNSTRL